MSATRATLLVLAGVLALEVLVAALTHRTREELERAAREGAPGERAFALHVLANRGDPVIFGAEEAAELVRSDHALLREFAMTYDFARAGGADLQRAQIDSGTPGRMRFFAAHQKLPVTRSHLAEYFAAPAD